MASNNKADEMPGLMQRRLSLGKLAKPETTGEPELGPEHAGKEWKKFYEAVRRGVAEMSDERQ